MNLGPFQCNLEEFGDFDADSQLVAERLGFEPRVENVLFIGYFGMLLFSLHHRLHEISNFTDQVSAGCLLKYRTSGPWFYHVPK